MNQHKYTSLITLSLSLSLVACSVPANKTTMLPATQSMSHHQGLPLDYEFALLRAPAFHLQKFLDLVQGKAKLTLTNGIVNPIHLTTATNLKTDELFSLMIKLSKEGEFDVTPTQANQINIKPLKPGAKATLTLIAGNETAVLELESPQLSDTPYLDAVKHSKKLTLVNGTVTPVPLTEVTNLKDNEQRIILTSVHEG